MLRAVAPGVKATLLLSALVLTVVATQGALRVQGSPFPSLFVDPQGTFSLVYLAEWGTESLGLRRPERVVAVEGRALGPHAAYGEYPSQRLAARVAELYRAGATSVRLSLERGSQRVEVHCRLRLLGARELLLFFVLYALAGGFNLWFGLLVARLTPRSEPRSAYLFTTAAGFVFLITFHDYHTRAALAPLFTLSTLAIPVGFLWLAYTFPQPLQGLPRVLRGLLLAVSALAVLAGGWSLLAHALGLELRPLQRAVDVLFAPCLASLPVSIVLRLVYGSPQSRAPLRSAAWALVLTPVVLAVAFILTHVTDTDLLHLALPLLMLTVPFAIGYSLIRNNLLEVDVILSRRMLLVPVGLCALICAIFGGYATERALHLTRASVALPLLAGLGLLVACADMGWRLGTRLLFPTTRHFRPALEQLSARLTELREEAGGLEVMEDLVRHWLPDSPLHMVAPEQLHTAVSHLPEGALARLQAGERLWSLGPPRERHLLLPMRSHHVLHAVLVVPPKREGALYTADDLALLEPIANLGGMALHHARARRELEHLRRLELEAARDDKRLALGLLSAEISHEIAYPLNFFRHLLRQGSGGQRLEEEDVEIGREELERLERMLAALRRLSLPAPRLEPVLVLHRVERALHLLRDDIHERGLSVSMDLPPDLVLRADPDALVQLFANLLRNAVQAAGPRGRLGVRAWAEPEACVLEVWDCGPGIPQHLSDSIFRPGVTTREQGSGLGLTIAQRIARSFGWTLSLHQEAGRTCFRLRAPAPLQAALPALPPEVPHEAPRR